MINNDYLFYADDEGVSVDISLYSMRMNIVQFIYLEENFETDLFIENVNEISRLWADVVNSLIESVDKYTLNIYSTSFDDFDVEKIYITQDDRLGEFGVLIRCDIDIEHGIGVRFRDFKV